MGFRRMTAVMMRLLVLLVIVSCEVSAGGERLPPVATVDVQKVVVRVGEDVKIVCPVEGSPTPITRWYKVSIIFINKI